MTDQQINIALAKAIGWADKDITKTQVDVFVCAAKDKRFGRLWSYFDYRDPAVIWPIAKHFDAFPQKSLWDDSCWIVSREHLNSDYQDTAEKAVALAVIGGAA